MRRGVSHSSAGCTVADGPPNTECVAAGDDVKEWELAPGWMELIMSVLWLGDAALCAAIFYAVPYTEIDWKAYMQEVASFQMGERNYYAMKGDTGPLVYPAGFVYLFSLLRTLTGESHVSAQMVFIGVYLVQLAVMYDIFRHTSYKSQPAMFALLSASRRLHSIFVLRCFNDGLTMTVAFAAVAFAVRRRWRLTCVFYSLAVSIKMNVLLMAPGLLFVLYYHASECSLVKTAGYLAICAGIQILLGLPFLAAHPVAYMHRAFELGRVFTFKWSVNFAFLPEDIFVSKQLAMALLAAHLLCLGLLFQMRWRRMKTFSPDAVVFTLFSANFTGVVFSRSLHYQFLAWYFPTLPFLLWSLEGIPTMVRIVYLSVLEFCWNAYPPRPELALLMQLLHLSLMMMLLFWSTPEAKPKPVVWSRAEGGVRQKKLLVK